jgi:hypothetical protein
VARPIVHRWLGHETLNLTLVRPQLAVEVVVSVAPAMPPAGRGTPHAGTAPGPAFDPPMFRPSRRHGTYDDAG